MSLHQPLRPSKENMGMGDFYLTKSHKNIANVVGLIKDISWEGKFILAQYEDLLIKAESIAKKMGIEPDRITLTDLKEGKMTDEEVESLRWFSVFAEKQLQLEVSMTDGARWLFENLISSFKEGSAKMTFTETVTGRPAQRLSEGRVGEE